MALSRAVARAKHGASGNRFEDPELPPDVFLVDLDLPKVVKDPTIALPRASMVPHVTRLGDADAQAAVRYGQLPDGTQFDPRSVAIVGPDEPETDASGFADQMSAEVDLVGLVFSGWLIVGAGRSRNTPREGPVHVDPIQ